MKIHRTIPIGLFAAVTLSVVGASKSNSGSRRRRKIKLSGCLIKADETTTI
jgi:hypothetical protein